MALISADVSTPYVLPSADDDICLVGTLDALLEHLDAAPEFVAADGFTLNYGVHKANFDIHGVSYYTPSIWDPNAMQRLYHLVRRYQPFFFSVIRTDAWTAALESTKSISSALFEEMCMMSTIALQGGVMRLPAVLHLRGMEQSKSPITDSHPFYWFLNDAQSFYQTYAQLRQIVSEFIEKNCSDVPDGADLVQLLDLIYATWLGREVDVGVINHYARMHLGEKISPDVPVRRYSWREPGTGDLVHLSKDDTRRYIWRQNVIDAEPRDEILIDEDEIARVERQLDVFQIA